MRPVLDAIAHTFTDGDSLQPRPGTRHDGRWVIAVAGLYAIVTAWLSWRLPLWRDEIYTLQTTAKGVLSAADRAVHFELQAPGYFVLQAAWQKVAPGALTARIPSVIFGTLTVVVGAALFARLVHGVRAWIGALVVATCPVVVWAGSEARCYALVLLLGVTFAYLVVRVHLYGWARGRLLLVLVAAAALYVQYYLGFMLLGGAAALVVCRRWRELGAYLLEMIAVGALFAPHVPTLVDAMFQRASQGQPHLPTIGALVFPVETDFMQLTLGTAVAGLDARVGRALHWAWRLAVVAGVGLVVWRSRRSPGSAVPVAAVVAMTLVPLAVGAAATRLAGVAWHLRYWGGFSLLGLLVPVVLMRAAGPRIAAVVALVVAGAGAFATTLDQRALGKWGDSRAVAQTLAAAEAPGEPILSIPADAILSLAYYYRGVNRLVPVPRQPNTERFNIDDVLPRNAEDLRGALLRAGDPAAFWLYSDMPQFEDQLEPWLAPRWRVERHLRFAGGPDGAGRVVVAHLRRFVRAD